MNVLQILYIIGTSAFVFFLPGLALSLAFFTRRKIDILERIALSIALSLSVVPLVVFYTNLAGIKITAFSVTTEIFIIIGIASVIYFVRAKRRKDPS